MKVVRGLPNNRILRLTALFHDLGKVSTRVKGDDGFDHFWGHSDMSTTIANEAMTTLGFDYHTKVFVVLLITYHDLKIDDDKLIGTVIQLGNKFIEEIKKYDNTYQPIEAKEIGKEILQFLFLHQLSDLNAHHSSVCERKLPKIIGLITKLDLERCNGINTLGSISKFTCRAKMEDDDFEGRELL